MAANDAPTSPSLEGAPGQEVRRRHVFYVPGYDPRHPAAYHRVSAMELRRFAKVWDVTVTVDRDDVADDSVPSRRWTARLTAGTATVDVTYETLRWDDLVAQDFATPLPLTLLRAARTAADAILTGHLWRIWRASPWVATAWLYPMLTAIAVVALAVWAGVLATGLGPMLGSPALGWMLGLATTVGLLLFVIALLRRSGSFVVHLMDDGRSQRRYARRQDSIMEARVEAFSARIRAVVADERLDEVLVVGHSSGSFVAIDAVARAYGADPAFARGRPALSLLTVGASELLVALHPAGGWFRERIRRLAVEPSLFWAEVVGPWDTLNFPNRDPVTELGLDVPDDRPNPTFRRAYLTKMLSKPSIDALQKGFRVFRTHFQFVLANEIRGPYDYFSLVCGPWTARSQFARTAERRLMSPHLGPAPDPLPRPDWMPPLPEAGAAARKGLFGGAVRPSDKWTRPDRLS